MTDLHTYRITKVFSDDTVNIDYVHVDFNLDDRIRVDIMPNIVISIHVERIN